MKKFVATAFVLIIGLAQRIITAPVDHGVAESKENIPDLLADTMRQFKKSDTNKVTGKNEAREAVHTNSLLCGRLHLWYCCRA